MCRGGAGNQQITAVMEQKLYQPRIIAAVGGNSLICRHALRSQALSQMQLYPVKQLPVVVNMTAKQPGIRLINDTLYRLRSLLPHIVIRLHCARFRIERGRRTEV